VEALRFTKIDTALFVYMLPVFLEIWRNELLGIDSSHGGTIEYFWAVLADPKVFETHLDPGQTQVVSEFLRQAIVEEIESQRGLSYQGKGSRPYRWMGALTTYGVMLPDLDLLWRNWWLIGTAGRAVAAIQYISCLMYPSQANPVFAAWTSKEGRRPPCLWDFEGHIYHRRWLEPNIAFLRKKLTVPNVKITLAKAVNRLAGTPECEIAMRVGQDFPRLVETVRSRCEMLPRLLETVHHSMFWEWPET